MNHIETEKQPGTVAEAQQIQTDIPTDEQIEEGKAAAVLAYIPFLCFVPLVKMRHNPFARHHGKQGLLLLFIEIIAVIFYLPMIARHFWPFILILCLLAALLGVLEALQGHRWKIPFIGDLAEKLKI